ncbi:MAG: gliding motility protein GldM [Flavobacteriales bacterium]|nr:gliding motility protein GldM [Flavobacteriales bacterium]
MASAKMPPRQRMINMMYLVLTAMLAMNVSKEVLDSFAVLDADLVRSELAHHQRSTEEYAQFDDMAAKMPEVYRTNRARAQQVRLAADSLVAHIAQLKARVIAEAEGRPLEKLMAKGADGRDTVANLMSVERKDDRETLTRMLIGSEPAAPAEGPFTARDLRHRIEAYRDLVKGVVADDPAFAASFDVLFDLSDRRDASGTLNNWESSNFYDVPLAAGIAALSKVQADVRTAENDLVKWLFRQVNRNSHAVNTLAAAVIPVSTTVLQGEPFRADVFLAASDSRIKPEVLLGEGRRIEVGADGKAHVELPSDRVGEQRVQGVMRYQGPKGLEEYPYELKYEVMAPLLVASPTKMNVLYRGVDNPVELSVPGVPADKVQATIDAGSIVRSGNGWVASRLSGSKAQVFAVVTNADGSTRRIGPVVFRVKDLPPPGAFVNGKGAREQQMRKQELQAAQGVVARLEDSDFDAPWKVLRYRVVVVRGSQVVEKHVDGNAFTEEVRTLLAAARAGERVYFEGIKAQLANGQGPVRDLAPLAFKVIP